MDFQHARDTVLNSLRAKGGLKNYEILGALGGQGVATVSLVSVHYLPKQGGSPASGATSAMGALGRLEIEEKGQAHILGSLE